MAIDRSKIRTQDDLDEPAPMDIAEDRAAAEMKAIESKAKRKVADGLQDEELARAARRLQKEAERDLKSVAEESGKKEQS